MKIKALQSKHPKHRGELWADYRALYEGGHRFDDRVERFLPRRPVEPPNVYERRKGEAVYRSYLGTIVDFFASQQFTTPLIANIAAPESKTPPRQPTKPPPNSPEAPDSSGKSDTIGARQAPAVPEPPEWYAELEADCDGKGTDLRQFLRQGFIDALITRWAFWRLDFPESYGTGSSKREADDTGATDVRLARVKRECVTDWEVDSRGNLLWAIVHEESRPRPDPGTERNFTRHTWLVMDREKVTRFVKDVEDQKRTFAGDGLNPEETLAEDKAWTHGLEAVPLVLFDVSDGLWVANRIASAQKEHFRLTSAAHWSMSTSCFVQPVFTVVDPDEFKQSVMGSGFGLTLTAGDPGDTMDWKGPPCEHLSAMGEAIKSLKDEIFRCVQQMSLGVENNAAAVGRTAESKSADAEQMHVVLRAYGELLRDAIKTTLNLLSKARGEDLEWTVEGLDKFETLDADALVTLYGKAQAFNIPSPTFHAEAAKGITRSLLPGRDTATLEKIDAEIDEGVPKMLAEAKAQQDEDRKVALEATKAGVAAKAAGPGAAKKPPFARA